MPYVVAQPCVDVKDKACVDECPVDCIYEGSRSLYINPNECVDCGACEPVCPTEAIFYEDDLPDEWAWYKDAAVSFFAEVGDLGGASAAGPIGKDPEQVAALTAVVPSILLVERIWTADSFSGPVRLRRFHAPKANRFFVWTDDHAVGPIAVCWSMV